MSKIVTSYILGSRVIEKHFTLNKRKGNDHYHSMDKNDLILLIKNLNQTKKFLVLIKKVILAEKIQENLHEEVW